MSPVLAVALPVFAVIAAGLLAGRLRLMPAGDVAALNRFVFRFAMPTALFGLTARASPPGPADAALALSYGAAALAVMLGAYGLGRGLFGLKPAEAGAHALASTFGNAVFLGLPIALSIEGWAESFVILMLVEGVGVIALGAALMSSGGRGIARLLVGPFRNPLVVAMLAGLALSMAGLPPTGPVSTFLDILGRAAGPTALFSLGLFLATNPLPPLVEVGGRVGAVVVTKLFILPLLLFGALAVAGVDDPAVLGPALLFAVVPSAVGSFVMASQYGVYVREAAAAVAVSTLLSVATVSAALMAFA